MTDFDGAAASTEGLQSRLNELKATKASLLASKKRKLNIPSADDMRTAAQAGRKDVPVSIQALAREVADVEERTILYRTAGWTVFEIDLDIGRRSREARRSSDSLSSSKESLGLGVRLETFHQGQFYEPYYLIFAKPCQLLSAEPKVVESRERAEIDASAEIGSNKASKRRLRLIRHTIPHFVPLRELLRRYFRSSQQLEEEEKQGTGGLNLLDDLLAIEGLTFFLSKLHAYLQSFVSRRQQAIALSQLQLPGLARSSLRAFGNDSFGQISIRWDLPIPTKRDLNTFENDAEILYTDVDGEGVILGGMKDHQKEGAVNTSLEITVTYHDLSNDGVGASAKPRSDRQQMIYEAAGEEADGLRCKFANVLVESVRSRIPAPRRGDSDKHEKLQIRRVRRPDWERLFAYSQMELHATLKMVMSSAWKEEMQRFSSSSNRD